MTTPSSVSFQTETLLPPSPSAERHFSDYNFVVPDDNVVHLAEHIAGFSVVGAFWGTSDSQSSIPGRD